MGCKFIFILINFYTTFILLLTRADITQMLLELFLEVKFELPSFSTILGYLKVFESAATEKCDTVRHLQSCTGVICYDFHCLSVILHA